jgi:hypothetical protein
MYGRAGVDLLRARMMTLKAAICTKSLAIGYEPLWAIGSGQIPTSQSTLLTLMPKVSVCASRMLCTSALSFLRSESISSSSPVTLLVSTHPAPEAGQNNDRRSLSG